MHFGRNLRKFRKRKSYTQEDLAKLLDASRQSVVAYENGRREPGLKMLIKIANVLGVTTDRLLGRHEYSISNNLETVKERLEEVVGDQKIEEFCKNVAKKTGFVVYAEKMENYLNGKDIPDKFMLKVMAMYAGWEIEYFYRKT